MITHHTQLLQALIDKLNLNSYLEIGVQNPANNFDKIKCAFKTGVDPEVSANRVYKMTSDQYFSQQLVTIANLHEGLFDLVFIDGLHHADQVKRDFENSLRCLSDNGFIVIHDVLPENEEGTLVPRQTKKWWGDVYKFAMTIRSYDKIGFVTYNIDEGCMLVWKMPEREHYDRVDYPMTWDTYKEVGRVLLNVTSTVEI